MFRHNADHEVILTIQISRRINYSLGQHLMGG